MKTFNDLEFRPHSLDPAGKLARMQFDNGYGVSVVRFRLPMAMGWGSYTSSESEWELAVTKNGELCYDSGITEDVMGHLTADEVTDVMRRVQELSPVRQLRTTLNPRGSEA